MSADISAASLGLAVCPVCRQLARLARRSGRCPRCHALIHLRKPASVSRTWALLIAAALLYVPANLLPIMTTHSFPRKQADTILSGVFYLWDHGSWPLAILVFFASIVVPMLKMLILVMLLLSLRYRPRWQPMVRTRLYRLIEFIGRWSMLDIYVVALLAALVRMHAFASVEAGPGALAFGAVVVLTMLASLSFDSRLIWDPVGQPDSQVMHHGG
ncbi:paraquat-inducible membrane protein A [Chitinimonas arctica]|uniref:Paraquat-inducible membrane protein A n=1 Tax=Chitinimonas arctica TaxID=2594795 RepID=A0A516SAA1_9NEIS|nr:paraquat-inducible protein A [Chitinimonas arctica]QDQ25083.1 paraquat-inducible membrane protein A [Chitinimonas arctica]